LAHKTVIRKALSVGDMQRQYVQRDRTNSLLCLLARQQWCCLSATPRA